MLPACQFNTLNLPSSKNSAEELDMIALYMCFEQGINWSTAGISSYIISLVATRADKIHQSSKVCSIRDISNLKLSFCEAIKQMNKAFHLEELYTAFNPIAFAIICFLISSASLLESVSTKYCMLTF